MKLKFISGIILIVVYLYQNNSEIKAQFGTEDFLIDTHTIVKDLDTPWEIVWGPDDHIWMTERYGRVSRIDPVSGKIESLIIIADVHEESESGLLGMALHPDFSEQPYVYLVYNYFNENIRERVVRYTYSGTELKDPVVFFDNLPGARIHNGSRIIAGPDEKLYFSLGELGVKPLSQDLSSLNGKILRMNLDGSIPDDNPFPESYVWSYGHRNPQGLVFTPDGKLYSSEHGPSNDDEVNRIYKGENYGWPEVEGFCDSESELTFCTDNDITEPMIVWTPTLAVAGLDFYSYDYISAWKNKLILVSLKSGKLLSLTLSADGEEIIDQDTWIDGELGRLRDICIATDGRVFISTSNHDGRGNPRIRDDKIIEIIPSEMNYSDVVERTEKDFIIYPNPAFDEVRLTLSAKFDRIEYRIFHSSGIEVRKGFFSGNSVRIDTEGFHQGYYFVQVRVNQQLIIKPLLIIN